MMENWIRKISYKEYDSNYLKAKCSNIIDVGKTKKSGIIDISSFQLSVCTAKSILTRARQYNSTVSAFARSYMVTLPFLLAEKNGMLAIDFGNKDILRDFSKSTRIGEIAQGINYYFARNYLRAYAIYDFKEYKQKIINSKCGGRTPDYVLCYHDGTIGIIESKGTTKKNPSNYLYNGYSQCENGVSFFNKHGINVKNSYSSVVSFATTSPHMDRDTCIYFADPQNDIYYYDENYECNMLYEYSKWFYLAGNRELTEKLMVGKKLSRSDFDFCERIDKDNIVINSWRLDLLSNGKSIQLEMGIKNYLMEYFLTGRTTVLEKNNHNITDNSELFNDGTYIKIR